VIQKRLKSQEKVIQSDPLFGSLIINALIIN